MLNRKNTITIDAPYIDSRMFLKHLKQCLQAENQALLFAIPNDISPYFGSFYWNTYSEEQVNALRALIPALITAVKAFIAEKNDYYSRLESDAPAVVNPISKQERGFNDEEMQNPVQENHSKASSKSEITKAEKVLNILSVYENAINNNPHRQRTLSNDCCDNGCDNCCAPTTNSHAGITNNWFFWYWLGFNNGQVASHQNGHSNHHGDVTCWGSCDAAFKVLIDSFRHLFTFLSHIAANCAENFYDITGSYANALGHVASNGADTLGHVASSGAGALSHVVSNGADAFGHVASSGVHAIGEAAPNCDGCGECAACCCASNGETPPPICGGLFLGLFGLLGIKAPSHATNAPTCSPTFSPTNSNSTAIFSENMRDGALYDFSKNSPVADALLWTYLFSFGVVMCSLLLAHTSRAADNILHHRAPRHTLQNILTVAIAAGLAGWGAHCMGYEMKTSIAWEITAMSFVDELFTWWTFNNASQKSFTLTCAQFNAIKLEAEDNKNQLNKPFVKTLANTLNQNHTTFMRQITPTTNSHFILQPVRSIFNQITLFRFDNQNQNNLQSDNAEERKKAITEMYR